MSQAEERHMATDGMALRRIDHVRMFVGNARQSAYFYRNAFGFEVVAYSGLETGVKHEACYVLRQGQITLVLASPLRSDHPDAGRLIHHGDGVQSIALEVDDVKAAFQHALDRGARPAVPPRTVEDEFGSLDLAEIHAYGDTTHTLLNRSRYRGVFAPGFRPLDPDRYSPRTFHPVGLKAIDHIVANVEEGKMGDWVDYYSKIMGFSLLVSFDDKDISTEYSALMSRVVADGRGRIKFPINEPAKSRRRSQIDEFLEFYGGPGVQHIAMATGDIVASVRAMAANDVSFLRVPPDYYEMLPDRVGPIRENLSELAELGILADRDDEGYLLQIFTKPVEDRPTLFFEIIQRRGARSFGKGNFKALFEAIEREQARRGTL
jgi:4-hydroxyphenylpyruvate dioxygenase